MTTLAGLRRSGMSVDPQTFARDFDRLPFGYEHDLSGLDLLAFEALRALAERYERDYFVASAPGTRFYAAAHGTYSPLEAFDRLATSNQRILLKRPELYDGGFADLLQALFKQVVELRGGLRGERIVRLESSILISSGGAVTPFHFDPEISFFFQIEGEKIYHIYAPAALTEPELERFYRMGIVSIGQVDLAGRDSGYEYVFDLAEGKGMHQPQNCPHWVETRSRTISYVFSFETDATRARGRTRACNHYLRALGLRPSRPGLQPSLDARKAEAMRVFIPVRPVPPRRCCR